MKTAIISDLHLGSRYSQHERAVRFIQNLAPDVTLVLNGDSIDYWNRELPPEHVRTLEAIVAESLRRRVIWIRGNHDECFAFKDAGRMEICDHFNIGKRLYITHGYDFDNVMPRNRIFIRLFKMFHYLRLRLGAQAMHVANYAKRFTLLYDVLRYHVRMNAVEFAEENGYEAITCGHTHYVEDIMVEGIRYINTGAWTETPVFCLWVDDAEMKLIPVEAP